MNHYVCCPLIALSSALHTGTNQLPCMKHDLQAEFWKAHEVFREEGERSLSMICATSQMCPRCRLDGQGVKQYTFGQICFYHFCFYQFERWLQGSGRSRHGICQYLNLLLSRLLVWMDDLLFWGLETEQASGNCTWWQYCCERVRLSLCTWSPSMPAGPVCQARTNVWWVISPVPATFRF